MEEVAEIFSLCILLSLDDSLICLCCMQRANLAFLAHLARQSGCLINSIMSQKLGLLASYLLCRQYYTALSSLQQSNYANLLW